MALLVAFNVRLHRPGDVDTTLAQLDYLETALEQGAAERMQDVFPEGYVFTWALYGVASAQTARALPPGHTRRAHLLGEARRAVAAVRSERARSSFPPELDPPGGVFYHSWSLYVLAELVRAAGARDAAATIAMFEQEADVFARALEASATPFLESYTGSAWPADTAVGVAALGIHDAVAPTRYERVVRRWVADARQRLDPDLAALPHAADPETGAPRGGVRGGSLALMSRVLIEVDPVLAREQYAILRSRFMERRAGIPGVREYPSGTSGKGDIDSGPLVLGFAGPATVVGAAAARVHGDHEIARALLGIVDAAGMPIQIGGRRRYAGGFVPVGDAFIAWARSSPLAAVPGAEAWPPRLPRWWFVPIHLVSALVIAMICARLRPRAR